MEVGKTYNHPGNGLLLFLGWDTFWGETSAKFRLLEYSGVTYLTVEALKKLGWI